MRYNLRLVYSIAKQFQNRGLEMDDMLPEGVVGLEKAIEKFEPEKGFRFSTYSHWWIRQHIHRSVSEYHLKFVQNVRVASTIFAKRVAVEEGLWAGGVSVAFAASQSACQVDTKCGFAVGCLPSHAHTSPLGVGRLGRGCPSEPSNIIWVGRSLLDAEHTAYLEASRLHTHVPQQPASICTPDAARLGGPGHSDQHLAISHKCPDGMSFHDCL